MERSRLRGIWLTACASVLAVSLTACGGSSVSGSTFTPGLSSARELGPAKPGTAGLGPIVESAFGGEIFGWDIDQNGNDGLLTETVLEQNGIVINAIETFDQTTGKIVKVVQKQQRYNADVEPVTQAVAGSDVGVIDVERDEIGHGLTRDDIYDIMNPVSGNKITRRSQPRHPLGFVTSFVTNNQGSPNQIVMGFYPDKSDDDVPAMYTYDTSSNAWGHRITFPRRQLFDVGFPLYAAVDALTNEAVTGFLKRSRYNPHESPSFDVMDASTGKPLRTFDGVGLGFINGMAIDSTKHVMCTTTTNDMDVEFYELSTGKGKAVQIPVLFGGGALTNGAAVAADPVHHLFLIAQLNSTVSSRGGSSVLVYDENGKLVEYVNGFEFDDPFSVVVPHLAVNPAKRTGYVNGPNENELQEFSY